MRDNFEGLRISGNKEFCDEWRNKTNSQENNKSSVNNLRKPPGCLLEITVSMNKILVRCTAVLAIYSDRLFIYRAPNTGGNVFGPSLDEILFDEIESITVRSAKGGFLGHHGMLRIICKKGTRYYEYSTDEAYTSKHSSYDCSLPNEILFDTSYNKYMEENFLFILDTFSSYKKAKQFQKEERKKQDEHNINIETFIASGSNVYFGDVSTNIDNSITKIEKEIEKRGEEDSEELKQLLGEIRELLDNIQESKQISENKSLFKRIIDHADKHSWFYAEIIGLIGNVVLQLIS